MNEHRIQYLKNIAAQQFIGEGPGGSVVDWSALIRDAVEHIEALDADGQKAHRSFKVAEAVALDAMTDLSRERKNIQGLVVTLRKIIDESGAMNRCAAGCGYTAGMALAGLEGR